MKPEGNRNEIQNYDEAAKVIKNAILESQYEEKSGPESRIFTDERAAAITCCDRSLLISLLRP